MLTSMMKVKTIENNVCVWAASKCSIEYLTCDEMTPEL